ncbi:MAG TPA: hypothetical protein VFG82_00620 [Rubrobacter sp.]|nr:hypothetical protein [Rubrobacter sp.]
MEGRGGPRIAFVGGGSYQWGPKIIQDVALNEELRGGTLVLHDINGEALEDMYQWGTRALDVSRADLKLEKAQRLEETLRGADFVVLSISPGGLGAFLNDPLVDSGPDARKMFDEMFEAQREYLPQF